MVYMIGVASQNASKRSVPSCLRQLSEVWEVGEKILKIIYFSVTEYQIQTTSQSSTASKSCQYQDTSNYLFFALLILPGNEQWVILGENE